MISIEEATRNVDHILTEAGMTGYVAAVEIGRPGAVFTLRPDEPVVLASVFKIAVHVAYARAVNAGTLDPAERTIVTSAYRTGGAGTGGAHDDVTASWRDLAELMMTLSDNAATDVLIDRLGQDAVDRVARDAGLAHTRISGRCLDHWRVETGYLRALSRPGLDPDRADPWSGVTDEDLLTLPTLDPAIGLSVSTARDTARLLAAIWTDALAPAAACSETRAVMSRQVSTARIPSGFPPEVRVAGKTGTLEGIRNEASVVTFPDGRAVAIAMFTRSRVVIARQPAHDRAMGEAAAVIAEAVLAQEG